MKTLLTCNITTRVVSEGTGTWTPPPLTFGDDLTLALRFTQDIAGQTDVATSLAVTGIKASIGAIDTPPALGTWKLQIGSGGSTSANTTAEQPYGVGPVGLAAAINALSTVVSTYGLATVLAVQGSYLIWFAGTGSGRPSVTLQVVANLLVPVSFGRVTSWENADGWMQELRFTQAPISFTSASSRILPPAPVIAEVQLGGSSGDLTWNEIQSLTLNPAFTGTYQLQMGSAKTELLDATDGPTQIQAAMIAAFDPSDSDAFTVTNPSANVAYIEFTGSAYAGSPQALLTINAFPTIEGDLTFTLPLGLGVLAAMLRNAPNGQVTLPMQVQVAFTDSDTDSASQITVISVQVTIQKSLNFPELIESLDIDWLLPPSPVSYIPFGADNVITGQQFYEVAIGNGTATVFVIDHNLGTEALHLTLRMNSDPGALLILGTDYTAEVVNDNAIQITRIGAAWAAAAVAVTISTAGPVAAFMEGLTVTIDQVTGLSDALAALSAEVTALQAIIPSVVPGVSSTGGAPQVTFSLPSPLLLFPGRYPNGVPAANSALSLLRPALLPAVNQASPTSLTGSLPSVSTAGVVYQNNTGSPIALPGGFGHAAQTFGPGKFAASDGRLWYLVNNTSATTSYFPADMEKWLFSFDVIPAMLPGGHALTVQFGLQLQLLYPTSKMQCAVVIEIGQATSDASPATTEPNLAGVTWNATPILKQRIILTADMVTHNFGASVARSTAGVITANKGLYGIWSGASVAPSSADFTVRARLIEWDTEDAAVEATGIVSAQIVSPTAVIQ